MKWRIGLGFSIVLAAGAGIWGQQAAPPTVDVRAVERVFAGFRDTDSPGCAVGVSQRGRLVYEHGFGMANLETGTAIRPASIFHVASVSKQFTAMAVLLLARDGKLSIDDDIRKYVPEVPVYGAPITIRHLLTHTSGLRDQWSLITLARGRFEEDRITEADVMDLVTKQKALNFTPGAEYVYSNTGFTLLAVIVKRVSGQSLREFADARMFKPLGMTSTHFHDDYTMLVPGRTSAYARRADGWHVSIPNFDVYGATSLFTTVGDLLKWEANFDAPVVADRATILQMEAQTRLTNGDVSAYGFGISANVYRGARVVEHGGSDAGYRSYVGRFPERGLAIAVLCNASTANPTALARAIADVYLAEDLAPVVVADVPSPAPVAVPVASLQRRTGVYQQPATFEIQTLSLADNQLAVGGVKLIPLSETRFRITGQLTEIVFGDGERAAYERRPFGGRPIAFEPRASAVVSRDALAAYAGDYYSAEVDARYRVAAGDGMLTFQTRTSPAMNARPVFLDAFEWSLGFGVQFTRTGSTVTGFEVTNARMRRVRFEREKNPGSSGNKGPRRSGR